MQQHIIIGSWHLLPLYPPLTCNTEPPSVDEICSAIKNLKNNKAAGEDDISPEFYKVAATELAKADH